MPAVLGRSRRRAPAGARQRETLVEAGARDQRVLTGTRRRPPTTPASASSNAAASPTSPMRHATSAKRQQRACEAAVTAGAVERGQRARGGGDRLATAPVGEPDQHSRQPRSAPNSTSISARHAPPCSGCATRSSRRPRPVRSSRSAAAPAARATPECPFRGPQHPRLAVDEQPARAPAARPHAASGTPAAAAPHRKRTVRDVQAFARHPRRARIEESREAPAAAGRFPATRTTSRSRSARAPRTSSAAAYRPMRAESAAKTMSPLPTPPQMKLPAARQSQLFCCQGVRAVAHVRPSRASRSSAAGTSSAASHR